ncbi:Alpha/Beta hydrolase protein [Hypoxylon argillaceum]|nr:Alpha/Beta hydrolase protein [Hypoxylon argillaceum]KAI1147057.1 Alpha/Beta hydrolase protein [Nemania diffusa]
MADSDSHSLSSSQHNTPITTDLKPILLRPSGNSTSNRVYDEGVGNPLIICFHGSGEARWPSWDNLVTKLIAETHCRVLLYTRAPGNLLAADVAAQMWDYLRGATNQRSENKNTQDKGGRQGERDLSGPYLLIAHSYGGAFARAFVQHELLLPRSQRNRGSANRVLGLVLVETGQEGGLDPKIDELQIHRTIMGSRPVYVIRGNTLLRKWQVLEEKERALNSLEAEADEIATRRQLLTTERDMLVQIDTEDERLKRRQLGLSKKSQFVHLPNCGHHVIRDRPDDVVTAVKWVLENTEEGRTALLERVLERFKQFRLR